jgi:hypothetical protein
MEEGDEANDDGKDAERHDAASAANCRFAVPGNPVRRVD